MKKLIRQWKSEISGTWDKFSFKGRIFLFATLSFVLAFCYLKLVGKELKSALETVKKKAPTEAVVAPDKDQQIRDEEEKAERLANSVKVWRERVDEAVKNAGVTDKRVIRLVLANIQNVVGHCELVYCRKFVEKVVENKKLRRGQPASTVKPKDENEFVASEKYEYKVDGTYAEIVQFLMDVNKLDGFFTIDTLKLGRNVAADGQALSKPVTLDFIVNINYLK
jgi:hypothetical protein